MTKFRAAVLGSPIEHSRSPELHQAAYRNLGFDWQYEKHELQADELADFVANLDDSWAGLSLTMPLKEAALALGTSASEVAKKTQSANTMVFRDGQRIVDNTDVAGLRYAIELGRGAQSPLESATILGTGATARSAVAAVAGLGEQVRVRIAGRTPANVERIVAWANSEFAVLASGYELQQPDSDLLASDLVVSTIPSDSTSPLISQLPTHPKVLLDVIYDPPTSPLAEAWVAGGGVRVGGLMMLVGQAAEQVRLMTGYDGPLDQVRQAMLESLAAPGGQT